MILQYCPEKYRGRLYGCGYGPIHPTRAFLDFGGKCPACRMPLKPYQRGRQIIAPPIGALCIVTGPSGEHYCHAKPVQGPYCDRHKYLNYEGR